MLIPGGDLAGAHRDVGGVRVLRAAPDPAQVLRRHLHRRLVQGRRPVRELLPQEELPPHAAVAGALREEVLGDEAAPVRLLDELGKPEFAGTSVLSASEVRNSGNHVDRLALR